MWLTRVTTSSAQPGPMLLWRSKHGLTGRTCSAEMFTRHKCCWNNAEVTFPRQCSSGENGSSGFFHISNVTNSQWNCVPGALLTLEVPNTCAFQKDSRCLYDAFMLCVLPSVNSQRLRLDLEHSAGLLETKVFVHGLFPRSEGHYGLHWFLYYTSQTQ